MHSSLLITRRPPRSTLFPYTTLSRSVTVNAAGTLATLTPSSPLVQGTVYTATVTAAVTDAIGTPLGADSLWSFTTDVAPTATAPAPTPNATGLSISTTVTVTFSKAMN